MIRLTIGDQPLSDWASTVHTIHNTDTREITVTIHNDSPYHLTDFIFQITPKIPHTLPDHIAPHDTGILTMTLDGQKLYDELIQEIKWDIRYTEHVRPPETPQTQA